MKSASLAARARFALWTAAVVGLLVGVPLALILWRGSPGARVGVYVVSGAILASFALLLGTTPADAIRLRRSTSDVVILSGSVWLYAWAVALAAPDASAEGASIWQAGAAVVTLGGVALLLAVLRRNGGSAWWATLPAWNPLLIAALRGDGGGVVAWLALVTTVGAGVAAAFIAARGANSDRGHGRAC